MKKKWKKLWLAGILAAAFALGGCSGNDNASEAENAIQDGILTVGILAGGDSFASSDGSGFTGIEPQLMDALGESVGAAVEYKPASSQEELLGWLDTGEADIVIGRIAQSDEYSQKYQVSRSYAKKGVYLLTRKNDYTDTLAGFAEMPVGISRKIPSNVRIDIPYLDQVTVQEYDDLSLAAADLKEETVNAVVVTEREALDLISDSGLQAQELLNGPREAYVALMGAGQTDLAAGSNQVISQYLDDQATGADHDQAAQTRALPSETGEEE